MRQETKFFQKTWFLKSLIYNRVQSYLTKNGFFTSLKSLIYNRAQYIIFTILPGDGNAPLPKIRFFGDYS
jgi:hypothetical protein